MIHLVIRYLRRMIGYTYATLCIELHALFALIFVCLTCQTVMFYLHMLIKTSLCACVTSFRIFLLGFSVVVVVVINFSHFTSTSPEPPGQFQQNLHKAFLDEGYAS